MITIAAATEHLQSSGPVVDLVNEAVHLGKVCETLLPSPTNAIVANPGGFY